MAHDNIGWKIVEKLHDLIVAEFPTSTVYKADLVNIPKYSDNGTFCVEIVDGPTHEKEADDTVHTADRYTFNIWIYLRYVDKESGQEQIIDLSEHLVNFLRKWAQVQVEDLWYDSAPINTEYARAEVARGRTITYLRVAFIAWSCLIARPKGE